MVSGNFPVPARGSGGFSSWQGLPNVVAVILPLRGVLGVNKPQGQAVAG